MQSDKNGQELPDKRSWIKKEKEQMLSKILICWLVLINLAGFIQMYADKRRAKKDKWRIPEKQLFLTAILGGSVGSILGMQAFRHKTKHKSFVIGMPAILILQIVLVTVVIYYLL